MNYFASRKLLGVAGKILVGTASWSDPGFIRDWFPAALPAAERLPWYAEHFAMVELNSSFYAVPEAAQAQRWCDVTPPAFLFNVKLHQLLSFHAATGKMLPSAIRRRFNLDLAAKVSRTRELEDEVVAAFAPTLETLERAGKLGALLLQLSPAFSPAKHSLRELEHLRALLGRYQLAVELRNRHWIDEENLARTTEFFREQRLIFVNVDAPSTDHFTAMPSELNMVSTPIAAYLRLHGRDPRAYLTGKTVASRFNYDYSDDEIAEIAERSRRLAAEAQQVHIIFNNNARDYAPHAALRLRKALGQLTQLPPRTGELF